MAKSYFEEQEANRRKEKKSSRKRFIIGFLIFILLLSYLVLKRSYHTKILPFQSITLNCVMNGTQNFPSRGGKYAPIVRLPKIFKIKFGYMDGEFIDGGNTLIENNFLKKKEFGYQYTKYDSILIKPTYTPSWIGPNDPPGDHMVFIFPLNHFNNKREDIWVDYYWMAGMGEIKDYDAHYECEYIK
jgi:hypothetical protein